MSNNITVFIDGSCLGNPGYGGIGIYIKNKDVKELISLKSHIETTNNRMEIGAFLITIKFLKQHYNLHNKQNNIMFFSDSSYFVLGWESVANWKERQWKQLNSKKNLLNIDLWEKILNIKNSFDNIQVKWIPREENIVADLLSRIGSEKKNILIRVKNQI